MMVITFMSLSGSRDGAKKFPSGSLRSQRVRLGKRFTQSLAGGGSDGVLASRGQSVSLAAPAPSSDTGHGLRGGGPQQPTWKRLQPALG